MDKDTIAQVFESLNTQIEIISKLIQGIHRRLDLLESKEADHD